MVGFVENNLPAFKKARYALKSINGRLQVFQFEDGVLPQRW
jgi:hypothetical protein